MDFIKYVTNEEPKKPYIGNLKDLTYSNTDFREILFTNDVQIVVMDLDPQEEIGSESHDKDQFFYFFGSGSLVTNEETYKFHEGYGLVIPGGLEHNIINTSDTNLKLFSVYAEPEHTHGSVENQE